MWEYNIAPAAGDLQGHTASPLNPRSAKVTLRTNSNSALAPTSTAALTPNIRPAVPVTPSAPIIPTIPAPPAATPHIPVTPQVAPSIGVAGTGGTNVPGTGGFNFNL